MNVVGITVVVFLYVGIIVWLIRNKIYTSTNHINYDSSKLTDDATIKEIKHNTVGAKGDKVIRTTVTFSDGFRFVSHDTIRENHLFFYTLSVPEEIKKRITQTAVLAHRQALNENGLLPPQPFVCGNC